MYMLLVKDNKTGAKIIQTKQADLLHINYFIVIPDGFSFPEKAHIH